MLPPRRSGATGARPALGSQPQALRQLPTSPQPGRWGGAAVLLLLPARGAVRAAARGRTRS
eukprot:scaffold103006_cov30-Tisochrysis_lutea.AAC.2